jgi:membrane fusion protein, multidrug efflux system
VIDPTNYKIQANQEEAALVFAQQQAARYQDPGAIRCGHGTECPAVHIAAHQQEAVLHTAQANLELAKRQPVCVTAQPMSAEATLAQAKAPTKRR